MRGIGLKYIMKPNRNCQIKGDMGEGIRKSNGGVI
jgi:hypothetical protein